MALSHGKAPVNESHTPFARRRGPIDDGVYVYRLPEVTNMTIWKEGQGNGKKSYTCGPAATRNMVNAMNIRATGSYQDLGENQWAIWEGTTTAGTSRANVANALNGHASQYGSWTTYRPATKDSLYSTIATDTYYYKQSIILNVDTEFFTFWNSKALDHFNFAYGYDSQSNPNAKLVAVGEEWDPIFIYGSSSYGNPYGQHANVPLGNVYDAVIHTSIHGIVA